MLWWLLLAATVVAAVVTVEVEVGLLVYITHICIYIYIISMPIPLAVRSKASVCGRSLVQIIHSNSAAGMDFCVLSVLRLYQGEASASG